MFLTIMQYLGLGVFGKITYKKMDVLTENGNDKFKG